MENTNKTCEEACQNNYTCVGWVYHQLTKTCNLFNKLDQLYEFNGTYFGISNCTTQLFNQLVSGIADHLIKQFFKTSTLGSSNNVTNSSTIVNITGIITTHREIFIYLMVFFIQDSVYFPTRL